MRVILPCDLSTRGPRHTRVLNSNIKSSKILYVTCQKICHQFLQKMPVMSKLCHVLSTSKSPFLKKFQSFQRDFPWNSLYLNQNSEQRTENIFKLKNLVQNDFQKLKRKTNSLRISFFESKIRPKV